MLKKEYSGNWNSSSFRNQTFLNVDFSGRSLVGADFRGAVCKDCDFSMSDLSNARFDEADLYRSSFRGAILYAVSFDNANLTRADFDGALIYGWLLNSTANITYARLLDFGLEAKRRHVEFATSKGDETLDVFEFGERIASNKDLASAPYRVGDTRFTFSDYAQGEDSLIRAQIYNRLKRLYRENHQGDAALHCQYLERYHLTRSGYDVIEGPEGDSASSKRSRVRGALAYTAEFVSGYGLKPLRVLRTLFVAWLLYVAMLTCVTSLSSTPSIVYEGSSVAIVNHEPVLVEGPHRVAGLEDLSHIAQLATANVFSLDAGDYTLHGWIAWIGITFFLLTVTLMALLLSSVFLRVLSE